jgi:hypothetical protein
MIVYISNLIKEIASHFNVLEDLVYPLRWQMATISAAIPTERASCDTP